MNCLGDLECEYHSKHSLIEKISLHSITGEDCIIRLLRNGDLLRVENTNLRFLIKPHQPIKDASALKNNDELLLVEDNYCTFVTFVKYDDKMADVLLKSNMLVDGEQLIHTHLDKLSVCGEYLGLDELKSLDIAVDVEYSRYLNNISIFKPLLSRVKNVLFCWDAEEGTIHLRSTDEMCLKRMALLMPVFVHQLGVLVGVESPGRMDVLARHIVWEYQYEDLEEANFAIGVKGAHIVAVRNMAGIAGAVLTKTNRLRIIAENKNVLREARSLLEMKREIYLLEESMVPMLVGKNAGHINDLISKTGLHCIHLPKSPSNGVIVVARGGNSDNGPLIVDPAMVGKRQVYLMGTRDSITSAKLLLAMEESVKDLRTQLESQKLKQNSSLVSSTSSVSVMRDDGGIVRHGGEEEIEKRVVSVEPVSWADTPMEESKDEHGDGDGGERDKVVVVEGCVVGHTNNDVGGSGGGMRSNKKQQLNTHTGGMVFTNSALSDSSGGPGSGGGGGGSGSGSLARHRSNGGHRNNHWSGGNNHYYRSTTQRQRHNDNYGGDEYGDGGGVTNEGPCAH